MKRGDSGAVAAQPLDGHQAFSFEQLTSPHLERVRGALRRMSPPTVDWEDVYQETMIKAYVSMDRFRGDSSVSTWLIAIGRNEIFQALRRDRRHRVPMAPEMDIPDPRLGALQCLMEKQIRDNLRVLVLRLAPRYRRVVEQVDLEGGAPKDVASRLNISVAALKTRLHRGRLAMRALRDDVDRPRRRLGKPMRAKEIEHTA